MDEGHYFAILLKNEGCCKLRSSLPKEFLEKVAIKIKFLLKYLPVTLKYLKESDIFIVVRISQLRRIADEQMILKTTP